MVSWHTEKKFILGLMGVVILNTMAAIWQGFYIVKTLDTDPPIIERIIKLEFHQSEQGQVNKKIFAKLDELTTLINKFGSEQSRRKPLVDYIERKINVR